MAVRQELSAAPEAPPGRDDCRFSARVRDPLRLGLQLGAAAVLLGMGVGAGPLTARGAADTSDTGSGAPGGAAGTVAAPPAAEAPAAATPGPAVSVPGPAAVLGAPILPMTVDTTNSFTTMQGTTAAGTVTINGHTWVADPTTHLYTTTSDLAAEWQAYYATMKAGNIASLNNIQRLEGNAEAVFENTALKKQTAEHQAVDRQDVQRQLDAMYAAMIGAGVDITQPLTQQQYLATENVLQGNATLAELGLQGHGLNKSGIARYAGYSTDFQNTVDGQTLYVGGGPNNGKKAIAEFFDDNVLSHMPFATAITNKVLYQLNQNGARETTVADAVTALNTSLSRTYLSSDFLQPPQLAVPMASQVFTNGQAINFTLPAGTFVDPQGQAMTYTATLAKKAPLPSWVSFNSATRQFTGTPPAGSTTTRFYVTATNTSGLHTTESFSVVLKEPAPVVANKTPNQKAVAGKAFSITVPANTFVDPLGKPLTLTATAPKGAALPSWLTFDAATGQLNGTAPVGTKSVTVVLTATNSSGAKAAESFAIAFSAAP